MHPRLQFTNKNTIQVLLEIIVDHFSIKTMIQEDFAGHISCKETTWVVTEGRRKAVKWGTKLAETRRKAKLKHTLVHCSGGRKLLKSKHGSILLWFLSCLKQ